MSAIPTLPAGGLAMLQTTEGRVRFRAWLLEEAARVVREATPERGRKRLQRHPGVRYGISRARNGCRSNPFFRAGEWFVELLADGVSPAMLQRLVDFLADLLALLAGAAGEDPVLLSIQEQSDESTVNPHQARYLGEPTARATVRPAYLQALRAQRATINRLILALERDELEAGRAAA